jgi:GMP reductase
MSSETAMQKHHGGVADYRSAEGRTVQIPYRGKVEHTIKDILGGLRSTMTYVGVEDIANIAYSARFVKTRHQLNTVFVK